MQKLIFSDDTGWSDIDELRRFQAVTSLDRSGPLYRVGLARFGKPAYERESSTNRPHSVRSFKEFDRFTLEKASALLIEGFLPDADARFEYPSAGGLYQLRCFVLHSLDACLDIQDETILGSDLIFRRVGRSTLDFLTFGQVLGGSCLVVFAAQPTAYIERYGIRGARYMYLEAGHACQVVVSKAAAYGLGTCPIGSFNDAEMNRVLGGPVSDVVSLYCCAVGAAA